MPVEIIERRPIQKSTLWAQPTLSAASERGKRESDNCELGLLAAPIEFRLKPDECETYRG